MAQNVRSTRPACVAIRDQKILERRSIPVRTADTLLLDVHLCVSRRLAGPDHHFATQFGSALYNIRYQAGKREQFILMLVQRWRLVPTLIP